MIFPLFISMFFAASAHAEQRPPSKPWAEAVYAVFKPEKNFDSPILGTVTRLRGAEKKVFSSLSAACEAPGDRPEKGDVLLLSKGLHLMPYDFLSKKFRFFCRAPFGGSVNIKGEGVETVVAEDTFVKRKAAPDQLFVQLNGIRVKNLVLINAVLADLSSVMSNAVTSDTVTFENVLFDGSLTLEKPSDEHRYCVMPCYVGFFDMIVQPNFMKESLAADDLKPAFLDIGSMYYKTESKKFEVLDSDSKDRPKLAVLVNELKTAKNAKPLAPFTSAKVFKEAAREMKSNDPESYFPKHIKYADRIGRMNIGTAAPIENAKKQLVPHYEALLEILNEGQL